MAIRILIVEDDPHIGQMLQASLSIVQYESDLCDNGTDALPRLLSGEYDLALLDVMLPGQDGFSLMEQARDGSTPERRITSSSRLKRWSCWRASRWYCAGRTAPKQC